MADNEQRMSLLSIGLVRGLVGQFAGILLGFALVVLIRGLAGYDEVWSTEPRAGGRRNPGCAGLSDCHWQP